MGPPILLDKSAIQALSADEAFQLGLYYNLVIPPILMAEILADFAKAKKSKRAAKAKLRSDAVEIARKLRDCAERYFCLSRRELVVGELLTGALDLSHRPYVDGSRVVTGSGKRGFWVDDGRENALADWSQEKFTQFDRLSAYDWRLSTARIDLERLRKALIRQHGVNAPLRDFQQLDAWVRERLTLPEVQASLLELLLGFSHAAPAHTANAILRWRQNGQPSLSEYAPYTFFRARVLMLFHFGLLSSLVGTRPTNRVDMEYLFYLPFCIAFSSGDEFHRSLAPLLLDAEQAFIGRDELKGDLGRICEESRRAEQTGGRRRRYPPEHPDSITWRLWQQHMGSEEEIEGEGDIQTSPEEREATLKMLEEFQRVQPPRRRHEGTTL